MKKFFLLLIIPFIFLFFYYQKPQQLSFITPTQTPTPSRPPIPSIEVNNSQIHYAFFTANPDRITLVPNFTEKKTSDQIMIDHTCSVGINGGFYDTANKPLGLFISNGDELRKRSNSALINGFISIHAATGAQITYEEPEVDAQFALQTGPLLILDGQPLPLAIKNDEHARRMVAAIEPNGTIIFLSLYNKDSVFDGPLLSDVPAILTEINQKELLNIVDAINLDGGSASAFYNESVTLFELTSVGSFFCVKTL